MFRGPEEVLLGWCGDGVGRELHVRNSGIPGFLSQDNTWGTVTAGTPHESIAYKVCATCNTRSGVASSTPYSFSPFS